MTYALLAVYWLAVLGLCVFGLNCLVLCWQFRRHRVARTARLATVRADYRARVGAAMVARAWTGAVRQATTREAIHA